MDKGFCNERAKNSENKYNTFILLNVNTRVGTLIVATI